MKNRILPVIFVLLCAIAFISLTTSAAFAQMGSHQCVHDKPGKHAPGFCKDHEKMGHGPGHCEKYGKMKGSGPCAQHGKMGHAPGQCKKHGKMDGPGHHKRHAMGHGSGYCQDRGKMGHGSRHGGHIGSGIHFYLKNADELGLSDAQIAELEDLKNDCKKGCILQGAQLKVAKMELHDLFKQDSIDKAAVDSKVNEILEMKGKKLREKIDLKIKAIEILTPEQRKAATSLKRSNQRQPRKQAPCAMMSEAPAKTDIAPGAETVEGG